MKKPLKCFVVMPFTETSHGSPQGQRVIPKKQWDHIYERWIKRAVESFPDCSFICKRSPAKPGNFIKGIIGDIASADLVIADLTGGRPNVYYELGIRHALRTGSIIITQHLSALPSDLASYFAFEYAYTDKDFEYENSYRAFEADLHKTIRELENSPDPSDSPVSDFLGLRHQLLERTAEEEKQEFRWILENIGEALLHNYQVAEEMHNSIIRRKTVNFTSIPIIDLFPLDTLYTRLFSLPWTIFRPKNLQALAELLTTERRKLMMFQRLFEQASMMNPDTDLFAEAFASLSSAIVGSRKRVKTAWRKILGADFTFQLTWNSATKRTPRHHTRKD